MDAVPAADAPHRRPAGEHYNAPMYLDCCGLVRKALRELREDFGFDVGRWNQAYQFDTLPDAIEEKDMKPGDLVFISGTYFNPKVRCCRPWTGLTVPAHPDAYYSLDASHVTPARLAPCRPRRRSTTWFTWRFGLATARRRSAPGISGASCRCTTRTDSSAKPITA